MNATSGCQSITIRGVSDYSDGRKNDDWHDYAALTAAVCAKALLGQVQSHEVARERHVAGDDSLVRFIQGNLDHLEMRSREASLRDDGDLDLDLEVGLEELSSLCVYLKEMMQEPSQERAGGCEDPATTKLRLAEVQESQRAIGECFYRLCNKVSQKSQTAPAATREKFIMLLPMVEQVAGDVDSMSSAAELVESLILTGELFGTWGKSSKSPFIQKLAQVIREWTDVVRRAQKLRRLLRETGDFLGGMASAGKLFIEVGVATGWDFMERVGQEVREAAKAATKVKKLAGFANGALDVELKTWGLSGSPFKSFTRRQPVRRAEPSRPERRNDSGRPPKRPWLEQWDTHENTRTRHTNMRNLS